MHCLIYTHDTHNCVSAKIKSKDVFFTNLRLRNRALKKKLPENKKKAKKERIK